MDSMGKNSMVAIDQSVRQLLHLRRHYGRLHHAEKHSDMDQMNGLLLDGLEGGLRLVGSDGVNIVDYTWIVVTVIIWRIMIGW